MYSTELENALNAMRQLNNATDMSVLASEFNRHMNYIGKQKSVGIKKGDTITWEYGGIQKQGVIIKVNRKTVEVSQANAGMFGATRTRIDKSMIVQEVFLAKKHDINMIAQWARENGIRGYEHLEPKERQKHQ